MDKIVELEQIEFKNLPDKTTKINAQNLNKIQENTDNALKKVQNVMNEKFNSVFYQNEVTGENINIKDALDYKIEKVTIDGKSAQASTTGKNLFINNDFETTRNNTTFLKKDGILKITATSSAENTINFVDGVINGNYAASLKITENNKIPLKAGTYTFSMVPPSETNIYCYVVWGDVGASYSSTNGVTFANKGTFSLSEDTNVTVGAYFNTNSSTNLSISSFQLEKGSSTTEYEPYTGGEPSPNPDYPQEIKSISGDVKVNVTGKNLLPNKIQSKTINGITCTNNNDGTITLNGTTTARTYLYPSSDDFISLSLDGNYTFSANTYNNISYALYHGSTELFFWRTTSDKTFSATGSFNNVRPQINIESGVTLNNVIVKFQLERGISATEYEPYHSNSITIDLQDNELCSIGDVRDQLVIENGNVKIIKKIGKVILNGTESSWLENALVKGLFQITLTNIYGNQALKNAISDYLVGVEGNDAVNPTIYTNNSVSTYTSNRLFLRLNTYANNLNGLKGWLSTHNITVYYVLETSQEIDLGSLSEENIEKLKTFAGSNNIIVNASLDTNVSIKYGLDLKKYIDNKIENLSNS